MNVQRSCENYIKSYVGTQWSWKWYREVPGCRILARERTRAQEEKDFLIWLGVTKGVGECFDIVNKGMRRFCYDPNVVSPEPLFSNNSQEW